MADASTYGPPVDRLLTLGKTTFARPETWPDYLAMGFGPDDIPELIRMAIDQDLNWSEAENDEVWAPVHAWRALGQLHAEAAIAPLLSVFDEMDECDWFREEMPDVFAMIGPAAIPALAAFLIDTRHGMYMRATASNGVVKIAKAHPASRAAAIEIISRQLQLSAPNRQEDPAFNGFLIGDLLDLDAVEAAPVIEAAFAMGNVDLSVAGDWEDVQVDLGLMAHRQTPTRNYMWESMMGVTPVIPGPIPNPAVPPPPQFRPPAVSKPQADGKRASARPARKKSRKRK